MRVGLLLAAAALLAGEAQAADQFDLVCKGEQKISSVPRSEQIVQRYRVDLTSGIWCEDECTDVRHIQDLTPTRIIFEEHGELLREGSALHIVDRTTGDWYRNIGGDGVYLIVKGQCQPAPFSGINPKTKF
jgi:hypothetical protein